MFDFTGAYGGNNGDNIVPRAVVVLGSDLYNEGTPTIPLRYELLMNSYFESDTLTMIIPSELIDISKMITESRLNGKYIGVELWSGFLPSQNPQHVWHQASQNLFSNDQLKKELLKEYKKKMTRRWFGVLDTPTMKWSKSSGDYVTLVCREMHTILSDYFYEKKYEGDKATVGQIINDISNYFKFIKILKGDVGREKLNIYMGYSQSIAKDGGEKTEEIKEYNTVGKTVWQIIVEVCSKAKLDFIQSETDPFTYYFTDRKSSSTLWELDYKYHFNELELTEGRGDVGNQGSIGVIVTSKQTNKENPVLTGTFPKNLSENPAEVRKIVKVYDTGVDLTQEQLDNKALQIALGFASYQVTGTMIIPNAITNLKPNHQIVINDTRDLKQEERRINLYTGSGNDKIRFKTTSIQESYSYGKGLSQSIEIELDYTTNNLDLKTGKIKPLQVFPDTSKKDNKISNDMKFYNPKFNVNRNREK